MSAATLPFTSAQSKADPWIPSDRDRLIFQWVKFDGQTQSWVADQLEISQSTVSRIVERYERWIARGGPAQQGGLTHDERLRTQRWLTYERNERILASALRIAGEMEQAIEASKSTIRRPMGNPGAETQVFTEHRMIDRSGLAARYLRLAYRINMDQLKLVQQEPLPALDPLTLEDLGANAFPANPHDLRGNRSHTEPQSSQTEDFPEDDALPKESLRASVPQCETPAAELKPENRKLQTTSASVSVIDLSPNASPLHKTHNPQPPKSTSTTDPTTTSAQFPSQKNPAASAYPSLPNPPETTPTRSDLCPLSPDSTAPFASQPFPR